MKLIQTDSPLVGLSTDTSIPEEPRELVKVAGAVAIEPSAKYLAQLTLAHSARAENPGPRVVEGTSLAHTWLCFTIAREQRHEGGYVTLSADLDGTVPWQKSYRVRWKAVEILPGRS